MLNNLLTINMLNVFPHIIPSKVKFVNGATELAHLNLSSPFLFSVHELENGSSDPTFEKFFTIPSVTRRFNHFFFWQLNGKFVNPVNYSVIKGHDSISLYVEPHDIVECFDKTIHSLSSILSPSQTTFCNNFINKLKLAISTMEANQKRAPNGFDDFFFVTVDIILAKNQIK